MNIGVIGFGARAEGLLRNFNIFDMDVKITAVLDKNIELAKNRIKSAGFDLESVKFYNTVNEMIENSNLDGIMISTNCDTHTDFAIEVMKYNIPILLEKPVSTTFEQLKKLKIANESFKSQAIVSFPLRYSILCQLVKEVVDSGKLGTVEHIQAINNVTYGRVYYHDWYRNDKVTGGLFLQKTTHDLDYINYLLGIKPISICAMESKQIFKGDKEEGLLCINCDEYKTCIESPHTLKNKYFNEYSHGEYCALAKDTGNHDSGSVLVKYETGMHIAYTQNFYARKDAGRRGAILIGYKGTLEFDFITGEMKIYSHTMPKIETHKIKSNEAHFGGDKAMCENFIELMKGTSNSIAPLSAGIESALMCLYAKESAKNNMFYELNL